MADDPQTMAKNRLPVYLDCNATSPLEPSIKNAVLRFTTEEYGNAGSRTHEYGNRAKHAVQEARDRIANALRVERDEVIFTSGATESNNIALLGLAPFGDHHERKHIITSMIEHKAVLEPVEALRDRGFSVTTLPSTTGGYIDPFELSAALRPDTLAVSVMHVNNETGVEQPLRECCEALKDHPAYFHVDAAQGFGKKNDPLRHARIDLISISAHKIYGPKGVGALITRRRGTERPPLSPLMYGGGQERGLRPGTLPVPLIVGFGLAAELARKHANNREQACRAFRARALRALAPLGVEFNGDQDRALPHTLNISVPGLDAEAFMLATKHLIALSNGSACTSQSYQPSHVLRAMSLGADRIQSSLRFSWCHLTPDVDWDAVVAAVQQIR
jgi:cysteine desulfurase